MKRAGRREREREAFLLDSKRTKRAKEKGIIRFCQYLISPGRGLTKNGSYASGITLGKTRDTAAREQPRGGGEGSAKEEEDQRRGHASLINSRGNGRSFHRFATRIQKPDRSRLERSRNSFQPGGWNRGGWVALVARPSFLILASA